jgi:tricarballylate dehydrogenase
MRFIGDKDGRAKPPRPGVGPPAGQAPEWSLREWDVIVAGGGNAALVAALTANDHGASVLLLERAPRHMRGGNTRHTRDIRCAHGEGPYTTGVYTLEESWADICNVGEGVNNEELAMFTVREAMSVPDWMSAHGVLWQPPLAGTLHLGRTNLFFLGGGKALVNAYYREAGRRPDVTVAYDAKLEEFEVDGETCSAVTVRVGDAPHRVRAKAVICASGGFEANVEWLRRYWGDAADNYIIRGTPYNDGHVLARLYDLGARSAGQAKGFHAIALDARSPRFDGGIATRLDTIPFGLVVNKFGQRFYDEGEDFWPKRYAIWGRNIAEQPGQIAYSFWDSKVRGQFMPPMYGANSSASIAELAAGFSLDPEAVTRTIADFNASVVPGGGFDPGLLDGCRTKGLSPDKTNWALPLDTPPYYAIAMRPGITFTYMGVTVDADAHIVREDGTRFDNVFAAGEIMSGNILSTGYLAGFGLTIGAVWGRVAGKNAAARVR